MKINLSENLNFIKNLSMIIKWMKMTHFNLIIMKNNNKIYMIYIKCHPIIKFLINKRN
jgi:hypothetical protein